MNIKLTQSQARLLKECLKLYDTQLLTSSEDWKEYDNLYEKLAGLSDTSRDDDFSYKDSQYSDKSYWVDKHNPWTKYNDKRVYNAGDLRENKQRVGKDMDLL